MTQAFPRLRVSRRGAIAAAVLACSAATWGATDVAAATAAAAVAPAAVTSFSYTSATGDYIGGGIAQTFTSSTATITLTGTASELHLALNTPGFADFWYVDLAAPSGQKLLPGSYSSAERDPFQTGRAPGLSVSGDGRGCNQDFGSFTINQIATNSAGNLTMVDASFVQRCESLTAPAMTGTVKFAAKPLDFAISSQPGDYLGQGLHTTYVGASSIFTLGGTATGIGYSVSGRRDNWSISLAPKTGGKLIAGSYANAQQFASSTNPGLSVSVDGRGCNTEAGSFVISWIATNTVGTVTALDATFSDRCDNAAGVLSGTIHFNPTLSAAIANPPVARYTPLVAGTSSFSYTSAPGDWVGGGLSQSFTSANASITVSGTASDLAVSVTNSTATWYINLAAPAGQQLLPGTYKNAERAPFRTGRSPGVDVSGDGRGCNADYGTVTINQIGVNAGGAVIMLDAAFVQNCESALAPPMTGTVKVAAPHLAYAFQSQPGDWVGGGASRSYGGATSTFALSGNAHGIVLGVSGRGDGWSVSLTAPAGQNLRVGRRYATTSGAALAVSGDGRGCSTFSGTFSISSIQVDSLGTLLSAAGSFTQQCDNASGVLNGQFAINS